MISNSMTLNLVYFLPTISDPRCVQVVFCNMTSSDATNDWLTV